MFLEGNNRHRCQNLKRSSAAGCWISSGVEKHTAGSYFTVGESSEEEEKEEKTLKRRKNTFLSSLQPNSSNLETAKPSVSGIATDRPEYFNFTNSNPPISRLNYSGPPVRLSASVSLYLAGTMAPCGLPALKGREPLFTAGQDAQLSGR